jgi:hypothetical protein
MRDDLVALKVEVDPILGAAPLRAAQQPTIKGAGLNEVVDRKGHMEWRERRHQPPA